MRFRESTPARLPAGTTTFPNRRAKATTAACAAAALLCLPAIAQLTPDAPVSNFRLPMFGETGSLIWDLRGREGRYVNENRVELTGMRLVVYDENQQGRVDSEIISPQAVMRIDENRIVGDETITVIGYTREAASGTDREHFRVEGERWRWNGDDKSVEIDENVKVTFFEELTGILQ